MLYFPTLGWQIYVFGYLFWSNHTSNSLRICYTNAGTNLRYHAIYSDLGLADLYIRIFIQEQPHFQELTNMLHECGDQTEIPCDIFRPWAGRFIYSDIYSGATTLQIPHEYMYKIVNSSTHRRAEP